MQRLILVRYGTYSEGTINNQGRREMESLAQKLSRLLKAQKTRIIAANVARAKESAEVLASSLNVKDSIATFEELYAAEEEGHLTNLSKAGHRLIEQGEGVDFLIAVASREYIETLPKFFITDILKLTRTLPVVSLGRGEAVIIDCREGFTDFVRDRLNGVAR